MKMMRLMSQMIFFYTLLAVVSIASVSIVVAAEEQIRSQSQEGVHERETSKWNEAGQEVKKASGAVVDASRETVETVGEKTKEAVGVVREQSKYFWQRAWIESRHAWEEGKAKIHEVTAPNPPTPPVKSAATPPTVPVEPAKPATSTAVQ